MSNGSLRKCAKKPFPCEMTKVQMPKKNVLKGRYDLIVYNPLEAGKNT